VCVCVFVGVCACACVCVYVCVCVCARVLGTRASMDAQLVVCCYVLYLPVGSDVYGAYLWRASHGARCIRLTGRKHLNLKKKKAKPSELKCTHRWYPRWYFRNTKYHYQKLMFVVNFEVFVYPRDITTGTSVVCLECGGIPRVHIGCIVYVSLGLADGKNDITQPQHLW